MSLSSKAISSLILVGIILILSEGIKFISILSLIFNFFEGDLSTELLILTCSSSIIFFKLDLVKSGINFVRITSRRLPAFSSLIENFV